MVGFMRPRAFNFKKHVLSSGWRRALSAWFLVGSTWLASEALVVGHEERWRRVVGFVLVLGGLTAAITILIAGCFVRPHGSGRIEPLHRPPAEQERT
jgi:hypothetical protein